MHFALILASSSPRDTWLGGKLELLSNCSGTFWCQGSQFGQGLEQDVETKVAVH